MNEIDFEAIKSGNRNEFEKMFNTYYADLCAYSFLYLDDESESKNLVQELFIHLWEKRKSVTITSSLRAYLFQSTRNKSLNYIRDHKKKSPVTITSKLENEIVAELDSFEDFDKNHINSEITNAIESLPPKCKEIFLLSRQKSLTYREIAEELNISQKTVENQMGIALKKLKHKLSPILFVLMIHLLQDNYLDL